MTDGAELLGSQPLADALAAGDVPAIARALRLDVVVVPQFVTPEGEEQVRVFGSEVPEKPYRLYLFSSAEALAAFLPPDDPQRSFEVVAGTSLAGFLDLYLQQLDLVVFDAAGPHTMTASPHDVRAALVPSADDDAVAWIVEGPPSTDAAEPAVALDLALPEWLVVDALDGPAAGEALRSMLARRLIHVRGTQRKRDRVREWVSAAVAEAQAESRRLLGFSVAPHKKLGAAFFCVVVDWPAVEDVAALESRLRSGLRRGDSVDRLPWSDGVALRHVHAVDDGTVVEYRLVSPTHSAHPLLRFSTPSSEAAGALVELADGVVERARLVAV